jgi:hypothetical protein
VFPQLRSVFADDVAAAALGFAKRSFNFASAEKVLAELDQADQLLVLNTLSFISLGCKETEGKCNLISSPFFFFPYYCLLCVLFSRFSSSSCLFRTCKSSAPLT